MVKISTSILSVDNKIEAVQKLNNTDIDCIHYDVMDGKFVNNKAFSIKEIKKINKISHKTNDVHLMVINPLKYLRKLKKCNIDYFTFHIELNIDKNKLIKKIKKQNIKVGLAVNPETEIEKIISFLPDIDLILLMSVNPGQGGQIFIENTINKIKELKKIIKENNYNILISVDGGINDSNISKVEKAGVDIAVVGSYITNSNNYQEKISKLKEDN